ncbi:polynucleotide 5'-hydroxyl-kinase [Cardiosporidium cionae]|uniref:Polynucleotide 5'-hydroxyl-kinase n=1 Tax=Cardiosporidium cionae TaxID=476202 RepID=A0ABQ7JAZ7_9APIC|nr:polynucleotide 5'-hydroxyl-kinase [Cardiosporidium cionae]|eukprot:KAF8821180.1 polynucleotide 5'-hydroxyl-kinase [Cardiosporidium cionae]
MFSLSLTHISEGVAVSQLLPAESSDRRRFREKIAANTAEIFGQEMLVDRVYPIRPGSRFAIFTWGGCVIQVQGNVNQEYEASNNSMKEYLNFAIILDSRRELAALRGTIGPRLMLVGAASSGKSSVCHILSQYALKTAWNPIYIELDPRCSTDKDSVQFLPGMIGATVVGGLQEEEPQNPLSFYFGHMDVQDEPKLYLHVRLFFCGVVFIAKIGFIINAPYLASTELLEELIDIFKVDIVAVVDNPSLKQNMIERYFVQGNPSGSYPEEDAFSSINGNAEPEKLEGETAVSVVGISKMEGAVVVRSHLFSLRRLRWRTYFLGSVSSPLKPQTLRIRYSDYYFLRYDALAAIPLSALPADHAAVADETVEVSPWNGSPKTLLNAILCVSGSNDLGFVSKCPIACILHVRNIEEKATNEVGDGESPAGVEYIIDLWCPLVIDGKLFSRHIIVPSDLKQLKWHSDTF